MAPDHRIAARLADRELVRQAIDAAIARAYCTRPKLVEHSFDALLELAALVEAQVTGLEFLGDCQALDFHKSIVKSYYRIVWAETGDLDSERKRDG
jgi:hypothetical protein